MTQVAESLRWGRAEESAGALGHPGTPLSIEVCEIRLQSVLLCPVEACLNWIPSCGGDFSSTILPFREMTPS